MHQLDALVRCGAMCWRAEDHAWIGDPERVVERIASIGFVEYRREIASHGPRAPSGGVWQGLDPRTGTVATVIWVAHPTAPESHVFIDIDGRPVEGSPWDEIDAAVLGALAAAGGRATLPELARRVGLSEGAVQSVVSMLAGQGKVRIAAVELPCHDPVTP
jgi:hypothetical protein